MSYNILNLRNLREPHKIFCLSMQRTGTTSVGKFFRDFGYKWAGWPTAKRNDWGSSWYDGDYEKIFDSSDFRKANAFEDPPWFMPGFYKVLYHRFPESKFILFTRDQDKWFDSMIKHSDGNVLGKSRIHAKIYRREKEYFELLDSGNYDEISENQFHSNKTMKLYGHDEHYKELYKLHTTEVIDFFRRHSPSSLHVGRLEDPEKWIKLGHFLDLDVPRNYEAIENVSLKK